MNRQSLFVYIASFEDWNLANPFDTLLSPLSQTSRISEDYDLNLIWQRLSSIVLNNQIQEQFIVLFNQTVHNSTQNSSIESKQFLRMLSFFPNGLDKTFFQKYRVWKEHFATWQEHRLLVLQDEKIFAQPLISFFLFHTFPLEIPTRRLSLPLPLILCRQSGAFIHRYMLYLMDRLDNPLFCLTSYFSSDFIGRIKKEAANMPLIGKRVLSLFLLYEIYFQLHKSIDSEKLVTIIQDDEIQNLFLFQRPENLSFFLFPHTEDKTGTQSVVPIEIPANLMYYLAEKLKYDQIFSLSARAKKKIENKGKSIFNILAEPHLSPSLTATEDAMKQIILQRRKVFSFLRQLLGIIYIYPVPVKDNVPHLNYLPIEMDHSVAREYYNVFLLFLVQKNLIEKSNMEFESASWRLTENAAMFDDLNESKVAQVLLYFFLWHPGLTYLQQLQVFDSRLQEEIKFFVTMVLFLNRGKWIDLVLDKDVPDADLFFVPKIPENWPQYFSSREEMVANLQIIADFFVNLGWLYRMEKNIYYVPADFPEWNPMGNISSERWRQFVEKSSRKNFSEKNFEERLDKSLQNNLLMENKNKESFDQGIDLVGQSLSYIEMFDVNAFRVYFPSLKDIVFMSSWATWNRWGGVIEARIDLKKMEEFQENKFSEKKEWEKKDEEPFSLSDVQSFIEKRLLNQESLNLLRLDKAFFYHRKQIVYYAQNKCVLCRNENLFTSIQSFFSPAYVAHHQWITKDGYLLILLPQEMERSFLEKMKEADIEVMFYQEKKKNFWESKATLDFYYYEFFFQRLYQYMVKTTPTHIFYNEKEISPKISGEQLTSEVLYRMVQEAINNKNILVIDYHAKSHDYRPMQRTVNPEKIENNYLHAFCYLRQEKRIFSLERITSIQIVHNK